MVNTTSADGREVVFWTCDPGSEWLSCDTIAEAVQEWAASEDGPLPEEVTVYGFARMQPDAEWLAERRLEDLIEVLDEEYGNPDVGEYTKPTDPMKAAARAFVDAVLAEYTIWMCEEVTQQTVAVADYCEEVA